MPESDYLIPLPAERKYAQRTTEADGIQNTGPTLWLSAMDHSRMLSVVWGKVFTEKYGEKRKCSWLQLC